MKATKTHILLCDDDVNLTSVLAEFLRDRGYEVITARDGNDGLSKLGAGQCDICVVDSKMPKHDGFEFLENMRKTHVALPVIMVFEHGVQENILKAYELGCDDYVLKPMSVELLICKIEAILRRFRPTSASKEMQFDLGGKFFDGIHQTLNGEHLSARENDLLLMLAQNLNMMVDRHLILRTLWQTDNQFAARSLSVYANRLRHLLAGTGYHLMSVRGRGYKLVNSKSS